MIAAGPFGSAVSAKYFVDHGTPMIRGSNLSTDVGVPMVEDEYVYLPDELVKKFPRAMASAGDLIFTCWGTIGQVGWISPRSKFPRYLVSNKQMRLRPNPEICNSQYLYYFFASELGQAEIMERSIGSSVPGFNLTGLRTIKVPLPPLSEQRAIAATLGALDDKIELNRKMNATLEAMARALFRDWFVDFGPTRAKMEGRAPYLSPDLWALFPDRLDDEGKPEGWESGTLSDLVSFNPKEALRKGTEAPYLDMAALPTQGANHVEPTQRAFASGSKFRDGDTLLARITPCLENGKTCLVHGLGQETVAWGSTEFIVMRTRPPLPPAFGYLLARDEDFRSAAIRSMTGTSGRQRATVDAIANRPFTVPPQEIMFAFQACVNALFKRIASNERESRTVAQTRDLLLPRLLSGELRVADIASSEKETAA
ncbi:MAG TPA: restriction endonuclease subunit S [Gemmobacter sp.]|nr:restriction endonuclease subunit S [Gemmobacter sp.]